jgi:O-antigen/teichoic acid export membrane protein
VTDPADQGARPEAAVGLGAAALFANVVGLVFTVVLARLLTPAEYGSLAALVAAFLVVAIAGSALQITVAREVATEYEHHDLALGAHVRGWVRTLMLVLLAAVVVGVLLRKEIAELIGVGQASEWGAAFVLATGVAWLLLSILRGVLQGLRGYRLVSLSIVGESALRLVAAVVLVLAGLGVTGAFLGSAASILGVSAVLLLAIRARLQATASGPGDGASDYSLLALAQRTWPALLALSLIALLQNTDVIMVKREAADAVAGAYAADAIAAKVIIWIAIGLGFYVVPESARLGESARSRAILAKVVGLILAAGAMMVVGYLVAGKLILELAFGPEYALESESLPILGLAMVMLACSYLITQYFLAIGRRGFLVALAVAVALQLALLAQVASVPLHAAQAMVGVNLALAVVLSTIVAFRRADPEPTTPESASG